MPLARLTGDSSLRLITLHRDGDGELSEKGQFCGDGEHIGGRKLRWEEGGEKKCCSRVVRVSVSMAARPDRVAKRGVGGKRRRETTDKPV